MTIKELRRRFQIVFLLGGWMVLSFTIGSIFGFEGHIAAAIFSCVLGLIVGFLGAFLAEMTINKLVNESYEEPEHINT